MFQIQEIRCPLIFKLGSSDKTTIGEWEVMFQYFPQSNLLKTGSFIALEKKKKTFNPPQKNKGQINLVTA